MTAEQIAEAIEPAKVTRIDGNTYGDGEHIVEFKNVGSTLAPMGA
jgi:hypothetical protein